MALKTDKVVGFVLCGDEVLVFEHPTTGTQFPAGTVELGEFAAVAARREVAEEVGVELCGGRVVGIDWNDRTRRFFAWHLGSRPELPEFCETDGHRFRPYWIPIEAVEQVIHPQQSAWWRFAPRKATLPPRFSRLQAERVAVRAPDDIERDDELVGRWMSDDRVLQWYGDRPQIGGDEGVHPAIIECDGEPVGYLQYYPIESYAEYQLDENDPPGAWALDLFIGEPDRWGEGIGPRAIELVVRYLDEALGVNDVYIDPWVDNERAISAYEKCGFRKVRLLREHEIHDDELIDCWLMHRPLLAPNLVHENRSVRSLIEAAFDGVPPPGVNHRTLYQAEAWDHYETCDQSRDHLGGWQDIPTAHLAECAWALPHIDEQGIRYYLPALMTLYLERAEVTSNSRLGHMFDSLQFTLAPDRSDAEVLRAYQRRRFSLFTFVQRRATLAFVQRVASSQRLRAGWPDIDTTCNAWTRAVRAGDDPEWYEHLVRAAD